MGCVKPDTRARLKQAVTSFWYEWSDAPWFVILVVAVTAFVTATLAWGLWQAMSGLF